MKHILILLLIASSLISQQAFSQEQSLPLWPNEIPGSIENANYIETSDTLNGWTKTKKVINPRLDFYPVNPDQSTGTAVIICPGGGYGAIAFDHEGVQLAKWFNSFGVAAFVLRYRLPSDAIMKDKSIGPLQDAQEAVRIVRRNAEKWNINQNKIGVMGFSAGGHLASTISTHYSDEVYTSIDTTSARPDFSMLIYPVISMDTSITHMGSRINLLGETPSEEMVIKYSNELQINAETPPAFLIHSMDDETVPVENSIRYALAMKGNNVPCELLLFQQGGHGYGMGRSETSESFWPESCKLWMKTNGF